MLTFVTSCNSMGIMVGRKPLLNDSVIYLWNQGLYSLQMIADQFNVSRQSIKKYLNRYGYDTSKARAHIKTTCERCSIEFIRVRSKVRNSVKQFCSTQCYKQHLHNPAYIQNRTGQRNARRVASTHYSLDETHIVHHKDGNTTNNDPANLMVFKSQSDHLRWHRLGNELSGIKPLWVGY